MYGGDNVAPRYGQSKESVPQRSVFSYEWRLPCVKPETARRQDINSRVQIGDEVWVRPGLARCSTQWGRGFVTGINSDNNVEIDGVPRHILDVRRVVLEEPEPEQPPEEAEEVQVRRFPHRDRVAPVWMRDYVSE